MIYNKANKEKQIYYLYKQIHTIYFKNIKPYFIIYFPKNDIYYKLIYIYEKEIKIINNKYYSNETLTLINHLIDLSKDRSSEDLKNELVEYIE